MATSFLQPLSIILQNLSYTTILNDVLIAMQYEDMNYKNIQVSKELGEDEIYFKKYDPIDPEIIKAKYDSLLGNKSVADFSKSSYTPWNVPFRNNPCFVGRSNEMEHLKEMLQNDTAIISQVNQINGMCGVGKTQLVVEYAYQHKSEYPGGILWIMGGTGDILSEYALLSNELGLNLPDEMEISNKCHQIRRYLQQKQENTLVVLDNLDSKEDYECIQQFLPKIGSCRILITSQFKHVGINNRLYLEELLPNKALELLLTESGRDKEDKEAAQNICRVLGNLPLAIEAAGKYLKRINIIDFKEYYTKLVEAGVIGHKSLQGDETLPSVRHIANLKATLIINQELMDNPRIRKILSALVCFEPNDINPEILSMVCGMDWEKYKDDIWELITTLDDYSLVRIQINKADNKRLSIHRLMREALRGQILQDNIAVMQKEYVNQLQKWFVDHNKVDALKFTSLEFPHILGASKMALKHNVWPQSYLLCLEMGRYYHFIGHYSQSLCWLKKSKDEVKRNCPDDYEKLGLSYNAIGFAYDFLKKYEKSIGHYKRALSLYAKCYGECHPEIAKSLNNLCQAYNSLGRYEEAISCCEKALFIDKECYGEEHPEVAIDLNSLGGVWYSLKKYEKAISCYELALSIDEAWYGNKHPKVALRMKKLGEAWGSLKDYNKAKLYLQRAYNMYFEFMGENHLNTKLVKESLDALPK